MKENISKFSVSNELNIILVCLCLLHSTPTTFDVSYAQKAFDQKKAITSDNSVTTATQSLSGSESMSLI